MTLKPLMMMQIGRQMTQTKSAIKRIEPRLKSAPIPLDMVARDLGLFIEMNANLPDSISGEIECNEGQYTVRSSNSEHLYRQRFTIAHEIGHFVLHRSLIGNGIDDDKMYRSEAKVGNYANTDIKSVHERQANAFAAKLLMPRELLEMEIDAAAGRVSLSDLYKKFQVSPSAMRWRLKNLGLHERVDDERVDQEK